MSDLSQLIKTAKEAGATSVSLPDGTVITFSAPPAPAATQAAEMRAEDLVAPALDEPTPEEILFWSTDYYDELQAKKEAVVKAAKERE